MELEGLKVGDLIVISGHLNEMDLHRAWASKRKKVFIVKVEGYGKVKGRNETLVLVSMKYINQYGNLVVASSPISLKGARKSLRRPTSAEVLEYTLSLAEHPSEWVAFASTGMLPKGNL